MNRARIFLILGTWIAVLPYLGFPSFWKNILFSLSGLILVYFSYIMYRSSRTKENNTKNFDNFSESNNYKEEMTDPRESIGDANK